MKHVHKIQALAFAVITLSGMAGVAQAADESLGVYTGTVNISGEELGENSQTRFSGEVKIRIPLTSRNDTTAMADVGDVETPSATVLVKQWSTTSKGSSPDSDGQITTWSCEIAAPTEVPMNAQGTLNIDYSAKKYSMFIALVALKSVPLKCVNSRSGAYKDEIATGFFFGTNEPDLVPWIELPFADASSLKATYQLVPVNAMKGQYGPVDMAWDLKLQPQ
ncbi:MAG TPA: hypothetical protein VLB90_01385 [Pseudomonadales bacterium]|nr:hypothetical protein [Pseudomonadales bacterium]